MTNKHLTLGLTLIIAIPAFAQDRTYKVKDGDTVTGIASKLNIRTKAILEANGLKESSPLKLGRSLKIPNAPITKGSVAAAPKKKSTAAGPVSTPLREISYSVRNGDFDWAIAKKQGLSLAQLYKSNPGVKWNALQVGQSLKIPTGGMVVAAVPSKPQTKPMSNAVDMNKVGRYLVQKNENDWIIAHKLGTTIAVLKMLNAKSNLTVMQPGQPLFVPLSCLKGVPTKGDSTRVAKASEPKVKKIRSRYAVTYGDAVTIRRGPGSNTEKVTVVDAGYRVAVLDNEGSWYKLKFPKGTVGWVRGDLIRAVEAPKEVESTRRSRRRNSMVASSSKASRRVRSTSSGKARNQADDMTAEVDSVEGDVAVRSALSMRGTRYSYGSASRSGTDCSGLTLQAMKAKGISLPRTSREQAGVGSAVSKSELKSGDLVFFKTRSSSRINHVGMYVGDGKFVHASSGAGKVRVNSLNDGYYAGRFVTARRVKKKS